ncbi:hypothetical protein [Streptomyces sp. TLI_171]|uniref:hypothetical protein n=1 Tax=Streptomyces sp. TLI_171 TaxID=1938859 RepID=UPI0037DA3900
MAIPWAPTSATVVSADGGAAHADAEHADRQPPPGREPGIDERHAHHERGAADPEEEPRKNPPTSSPSSDA